MVGQFENIDYFYWLTFLDWFRLIRGWGYQSLKIAKFDACKTVLFMLILYSRIRRFIVDLKSYFTKSSSDLYAAVRNAILENNVEALEQLKFSLNEDNRAASTISSDESFEYGLLT